MSKVKEFISWLLECKDIQAEGGIGSGLEIPRYEVMSKEFLQFAGMDLLDKTKKGRIGVLANLKRALDCQLDIFYGALNLNKIFRDNNLKFEQKTKFLADVGMVQNKSIDKLNSMRNKMEHKYILPLEEDLEIYYDLAWNVIEIISLNLQIMSMNEIEMTACMEGKKFYLSFRYDFEKRAVVFEKSIAEMRENDVLEVFLKSKEDYEEFVRAFKVYRSVWGFLSTVDYDHFVGSLKEVCSE